MADDGILRRLDQRREQAARRLGANALADVAPGSKQHRPHALVIAQRRDSESQVYFAPALWRRTVSRSVTVWPVRSVR
jgi:hypothetical protein